MSALPKTIEGTWEEITAHAHELAGHRLRVTVIDGAPNPTDHPAFDTSPAAVAAWVVRFREWATDRLAVGGVNDSRDSIYAERLDRQV